MIQTETRPIGNEISVHTGSCFAPMVYYLACPYRAGSEAVEEQRLRIANSAMRALLEDDYLVFSPLSHSAPPLDDVNQGAYDWLGLDLAILDRCDALIVLTVPGWRTSEGVTREIAAAERAGMPVLYAVAHQDILYVVSGPPCRDKAWRDHWLGPITLVEWLVGLAGAGDLKACAFCGTTLDGDNIGAHIRDCW